MKFNLIGGDFQSQSPNADAQSTKNWYVERVESGTGKAQAVLYPTPGLALATDLANAGGIGAVSPTPVRGMVNNPGIAFSSGSYATSAAIVVAGRGVFALGYGVGSPIFQATFINELNVDAAVDPVTIAIGPSQFVIQSGAIAYLYDPAGGPYFNSIAALVTGDGVAQVGYSDAYFIALMANSQTFRISGLNDPYTWDAGDVFQVQIMSGAVLSMLVDHRELWLFGQQQTVVYQNTGNADTPFEPVPGGFIEQGILSPLSRVRLDNSILWIGGDERGGGIAWRADGYRPIRISNHAVEYQWSQYSRIDDAVGYAYQDQGHSFWVIYFPTANKTWVYDASTQLWHERTHLDPNTQVESAHLGQCHVYLPFGLAHSEPPTHIIGDPTSSKVYEMRIPQSDGAGSWDFADDNGGAIRRVRRSAHISSENKWLRHKQLVIDVETGLGSTPGIITTDFDAISSIFWVNGASPTIPDGNWRFLIIEAGNRTLQYAELVVPAGAGINVITTLANPYDSTSWTVYGSMDDWVTTYSWTATGPLVAPSTGINLNFGDAVAVPAPDEAFRAPQLMVRWSDDGGHSWSNEHIMNCGKQGDYKARAVLRKLGRSRDRIYEISATDSVPFRIIEGYVEVVA
jgi:hypothetical protein